MRHPPGTRLCACRCGAPLAGYRADAKWATDACARRWTRANPGRSKRDAMAIIVGRAKAGRKSGVSIRIAARGAIDAMIADLVASDLVSPAHARERALNALLPLVSPRHRSMI